MHDDRTKIWWINKVAATGKYVIKIPLAFYNVILKNFFQTDRDLREMMNCVIVKMIIQFALRPSCYIVRLIESTNSENPPNYALVKMEGGKAR